MKRIFYCFVAAMLLAACSKDNPEPTPEPPVVPPEPANWAEWSIPANLPDNFEEELIGTPCWYGGSEYVGKIENGKIFIKNRGDLLIGGGYVVFVFDKQGWDYYMLPMVTGPNLPSTPYYHRANLELSRDFFIEYYPDSLLVFSPDRLSELKEGDEVRINLLLPQTKEFFEEKVGREDEETE